MINPLWYVIFGDLRVAKFAEFDAAFSKPLMRWTFASAGPFSSGSYLPTPLFDDALATADSCDAGFTAVGPPSGAQDAANASIPRATAGAMRLFMRRTPAWEGTNGRETRQTLV